MTQNNTEAFESTCQVFIRMTNTDEYLCADAEWRSLDDCSEQGPHRILSLSPRDAIYAVTCKNPREDLSDLADALDRASRRDVTLASFCLTEPVR